MVICNNTIYYWSDTPQDFVTDVNIYIFASDTNNKGIADAKCYGFKIYDNNTIIRDFIPVRIGNIGYLFDKVTGKMFGNSGTGNFILGPDL